VSAVWRRNLKHIWCAALMMRHATTRTQNQRHGQLQLKSPQRTEYRGVHRSASAANGVHKPVARTDTAPRSCGLSYEDGFATTLKTPARALTHFERHRRASLATSPSAKTQSQNRSTTAASRDRRMLALKHATKHHQTPSPSNPNHALQQQL
jgi:hypothetical protein